MTMSTFRYLLTALLFFSFSGVDAQSVSTRPDSLRPRPVFGQSMRSFKDLINGRAITDAGMITVYRVDDKFYFELPDSIFNREILVVNRISRAAAGMRTQGYGYGGDEIGRSIIRFERAPANRVFLRSLSFAEYARDSTSPMFTAVSNSNVQPIAAAFDVKSLGHDSTGVIIDMTDYINGDNDVLHFAAGFKSGFRLGGVQNDKSYIVSVRSFPINLEIRTMKTYNRMSPPTAGGAAPAGSNVTMELNSSLVLLPSNKMQPRYFDPRVGYFTTGYTDYDLDPQGVKSVLLIKRWRLEPKPEDLDKYKRGELVEPVKPIVFYIDPATPPKWIPYLMKAVNDWQPAFEKAGFKNAIMAKRAPTWEEDSTWSLDDARNSAIVYKPSDIANASGPSISDPRTGEIIESHINWYHNIMSLLRDWYFVQTAAVDTGARKMLFDDALMGELIRFAAAHEVGHTLGLRHNYGSSSTVAVENLRDNNWLTVNGHTPSIMDYARFNYVAQPEDHIDRMNLIGRIGAYDKWAIEYGYRILPQFRNEEEEKAYLNNWVIGKMKDRKLWFGTETNPDDPRSQSEQIGDDAMKASTYGIKNLQRVVTHLIEWTKESNEDYASLSQMYNQVTDQFRRYLGHVAKYIGGIMETPRYVEEANPVYEAVDRQQQKEALDFLGRNIFATPTWLLNNDIFNRTGITGISVVATLQDDVLNRLLNTRTLGKLLDAEASMGSKAYRVSEFLSDLKQSVWSELSARKPIDIYRRNLQKSYISTLGSLLSAGNVIMISGTTVSSSSTDRTDMKSVVRAQLATLKSEITAALPVITDPMTRYHLQDVQQRINNLLNPK